VTRAGPAVRVTFSPVGRHRVTVRGELRDATGAGVSTAPIVIVVGGAAGEGLQRALGFEANGTLLVTAIEVDDGVVVVEAEAMHNVLDDFGYEAFYTLGPSDAFSSNGVSMRANAGYKIPIALDRDVELPAPRYEAWILTRTLSPRLGNGLANMTLEADGTQFADVRPNSRSGLT